MLLSIVALLRCHINHYVGLRYVLHYMDSQVCTRMQGDTSTKDSCDIFLITLSAVQHPDHFGRTLIDAER